MPNRPKSVSQTGEGSSDVIPLNPVPPGPVYGFYCTVTLGDGDSVNYTVEVTPEDPRLSDFDADTAAWFDVPDLVEKADDAYAGFAVPALGVRVVLKEGSTGTVTLTVVQPQR